MSGRLTNLVHLALHCKVVRILALEALGALAMTEELAYNGLGVHT